MKLSKKEKKETQLFVLFSFCSSLTRFVYDNQQHGMDFDLET